MTRRTVLCCAAHGPYHAVWKGYSRETRDRLSHCVSWHRPHWRPSRQQADECRERGERKRENDARAVRYCALVRIIILALGQWKGRRERRKKGNRVVSVSMRIQQPLTDTLTFSFIFIHCSLGPETSEATGFIVDAERGYILTNRYRVPLPVSRFGDRNGVDHSHSTNAKYLFFSWTPS